MNGLLSRSTRSIRRLKSFHYHAVSSCALLLATLLLSGCDSGPLDATPELLAPQPFPGQMLVAGVGLEFDPATGVVRESTYPTAKATAGEYWLAGIFKVVGVTCDGQPAPKCTGGRKSHFIRVELENTSAFPVEITRFEPYDLSNVKLAVFFDPELPSFAVPKKTISVGIAVEVDHIKGKFTIRFKAHGQVYAPV